MYALVRARPSRTVVVALPSGRFLRGLGDITPQAAATQVFSSKPTSKAGHNQAVLDAMASSAQAGYLNQQLPALCAGGRPPGMIAPAILNTASGVAMKFVGPAFAAGPVVGAIVLAGAALAKVFGIIFGHHAAAIKKEQSVLCAAIPATNDALSVIDQVLASGQSTPQQAMDALDQVVSGFSQATASIRKGNDPNGTGDCNAACVWLSELKAVVARKKSQYQDLVAQQAQSIPGQIATAISGGNLSSLLPWAAAAAGLFLILKEG